MKHALYFSELTVEQLGKLLAAWNDLNSKVYDPEAKKIPEPWVYLVNEPGQKNDGQTFTITQEFKEGADPDKIALIFERDLAKLAENRIQARTIERRNAVYSGPGPDVSASTTEGWTPDFEFPGPWISVGDSVQQIKRQIADEGEVIYLDEPVVNVGEADVEVVPSECDANGCKVRAFTRKGYEWILKLS